MRGNSILYRIVAVDDGSTDQTPQVLEQSRVRTNLVVLTHGTNQGLGIALHTGIDEAVRLSSAEDVIVTMDADDSHPPSLVGEMLDAILRGSDVVIASRFRPGSECRGVSAPRGRCARPAR